MTDTKKHLIHLETVGLIRLAKTHPELEYLFRHALVQQVAYESLLIADRQKIHRATAEAIEKIYPDRLDELAATLAHHYMGAGLNEQAIPYLQRAGEQDLATAAFADARTHFEMALDLLPEADPGRLPIQLQLGDALWHLSDYPAARDVLDDALAMARQQENASGTADALYWLSQVAAMEGDLSQAESYLEISLPLARRGDNEVSLARVLYGLGDLQWRLGNYSKARAACEECLALARRIGDTTRELSALNRLAVSMWGLGDYESAKQLLDEGMTLAEQVGDQERLGFFLNNRGEFAKEIENNFDMARAYWQRALSILRKIGHQQAHVYTLQVLADEAIRRDDLPAARQYLHEGLVTGRRIGATPLILYIIALKGWILIKKEESRRGLTFMGLAFHHSASMSEIKRLIQNRLIDSGLDPDDPVIVAQLEAGKELDLEVVVEELLVELGEEA